MITVYVFPPCFVVKLISNKQKLSYSPQLSFDRLRLVFDKFKSVIPVALFYVFVGLTTVVNDPIRSNSILNVCFGSSCHGKPVKRTYEA